jgi:hypothetical protein
MPKFWIVGKTHPKTDGSYKKLSKFNEYDDYTKEEVDQMNLKNAPLNLFHDEKSPIGKIVDTWRGKGGDLWISAYIDDSTERGMYAKNLIKKGIAKELSLGHHLNVSLNAKTGKVTTKKELPHEVSIVQKARMDKKSCRITYTQPEEQGILSFYIL